MSDLTLIRNVTREECPWLPSDLAEGLRVERFTGHTYGCISPGGVAVIALGIEGFVEVPRDAVSSLPAEGCDSVAAAHSSRSTDHVR